MLAVTPLPSEVRVTTAATPMMMPRVVRMLRMAFGLQRAQGDGQGLERVEPTAGDLLGERGGARLGRPPRGAPRPPRLALMPPAPEAGRRSRGARRGAAGRVWCGWRHSLHG